MKANEMRSRCYMCEDYRLICYADGSSSIGCNRVSDDGRPVDIRKMDRCPRGHSRYRCKQLDDKAILEVLNAIYVATASSPNYISISNMISELPSLRSKRSLILAAIRRLKIVEKVSSKVDGLSGRRCIYKWNISIGPPSLDLANKVIFETTEVSFEMVDKRRKALADGKERKTRPRISDSSIKGVTSCMTCRLKSVSDCREKLLALGYDCKEINVNLLSDEVTVGF